jgi:predicted dehydrogenase
MRMIEACEAAGVPLFVAFCYRFSPSAMMIRKLVADGAIGRVRSLRLVYVWGLHGKYHQDADGRWIASERWLGRMDEGGPMVDCGVHQIDLARWWLDSDIVRATGHGAWVDQHEGVDHAYPDHVWLHLDHDNGAHTAVEVSFTYGHTTRQAYSEFVYELIGTDGMIRYDRNHGRFELRTHQGTEVLPYHEEKNFDGMYEHFSAFLHHGNPGDLCPARDAVAVTRLAREGTEQAVRERGAVVASSLSGAGGGA